MDRLVVLNPFSHGRALLWQSALVLAFIPMVGIPLAVAVRDSIRPHGPAEGEDTLSLLTSASAYFAVVTLVNTTGSLRRLGAAWGIAATIGCLVAVMAAVLAWLLVYWMTLAGGLGWAIAGVLGLALLGYANLGALKWADAATAPRPRRRTSRLTGRPASGVCPASRHG